MEQGLVSFGVAKMEGNARLLLYSVSIVTGMFFLTWGSSKPRACLRH